MRPTTLLAAALVLITGPVLAQTTPPDVSPPADVSPPPAPHRRPAHPASAGHGHTGGSPIDHGPFTPAANRAYQGGGVILEGAPGGPAPTPEPTPPGQMPRNSVPLGQ